MMPSCGGVMRRCLLKWPFSARISAHMMPTQKRKGHRRFGQMADEGIE